MDIDFAEAFARLGPNAAMRLANGMRPSADYLFNTLLPERNMEGYVAETGSLTIRSTMAGLTAMDSPYPPGGKAEASDFIENLAKIGNEVTLSEKAQRALQHMLQRMRLSGASTTQAMAEEVLNFTAKVIVQPHLDTAEWLRGQALVNGEIDWTFNQKRLQVDYGVPANHFLPARTGTAAYGGEDSGFWADVRAIRSLLRYNVRQLIAHPDTIEEIVANDANSLAIMSQSGMDFTVQRLIRGAAGTERASSDARDRITLTSYQAEAEIINPADPEGPLLVLPYMPRGKILAVGQNSSSGYRVGEGSTPNPDADRALGYTHIGPTVEGNGTPGRWADVFTPERKRYQLVGQGVTNLLPVIEAPEKLVVATTEMS